MTLIVEDGSGIASANAYITANEFKQYHAARGNPLEYDGSVEQSIIRATDYVDRRFGRLFKGVKRYSDLRFARATLTATGVPSDGDTVTLGSNTYTFRTTAAVDYDVEIGVSASASVSNLVSAVNGGAGYAASTELEGVTFTGDRAVFYSLAAGTPGNVHESTESSSVLSFNFATLSGGYDAFIPQPLEFPRAFLIDRYGNSLDFIPLQLKHAIAEYAYRILCGTDLDPDPTYPDSGREVVRTRTKVGPIEDEIEYSSTADVEIRAYPKADAYLTDLLVQGGGVIR